ncbi:MAG TPA: hypothetical protein VGI31_02410 [Streptosporangiaceae bacterium]
MASNLSQVSAWAAASSGSSGFSAGDVVLIVIVVVLVLVVVGRYSRRLALRPRRFGPLSARDEAVKQAAAADVAALEQDARGVSPDAPGVQQDEL